MRPGWASGRRPRRSLRRRWGTSRTQCCAYVLLLSARGTLSQYACLPCKGKPLLLLLRPRISGNTSSVDPCSIGFPAKNPKCRQTHTTTSRNPHYYPQYNDNTTDFYTKNPQSQAVFAITTAVNISKPIRPPGKPTAKLQKIRQYGHKTILDRRNAILFAQLSCANTPPRDVPRISKARTIYRYRPPQ